MRRTMIVLATLLLLSSAARAQNPCSIAASIHEWAQRNNKTAPLRIAAFDHITKRWSAYTWDGSQATAIDPKKDKTFEVPHTNEPTMYVRKNESVSVLVVNTNPLIYAGDVTASSEANIPGFEALQQFATLFGTLGQGIAKRSGDLQIPNLAATNVDAQFRARTQSLNQRGDPAVRGWRADPPIQALVDATAALHTKLRAWVTANEANITAASTAAKTAVDSADTLGTRRDEAIVLLQRAEALTAAPPVLAITPAHYQGLVTRNQSDFDTAVTAVKTASTADVSCVDTVTALEELVRIALRGIPENTAVADETRKRWHQLLSKTTGDDVRLACPAFDDEIDEFVREVDRRWSDHPLTAQELALIGQILPAAVDYLTFAGTLKKAGEAVTKLREKHPATLKLAKQLEEFGAKYDQIRQQAGPPLSNCWLTMGVVEVDRVERNALKLPWYKVRTEEFEITLVPAFGDAVESARAGAIKAKYNLARWRVDFGVDTALIFTGVVDREFAAASRKETGDEDGDGSPNEDAVFRINETKRQTRTGELALLLNFAPTAWRGFGLQAGFGLSTDNPAFYGGASYTIAKYFRISGGATTQRVTRLRNKQAVDQILSAAEDLSTTERFDPSWYGAVSFTLSELPIFKN